MWRREFVKSEITGYDNKRAVLVLVHVQYKGKGRGGFFMQIFLFLSACYDMG